MSNFRFKQFTIEQDQTAMKVNTDGVLLGAWTVAENPKEILDIGTGTGVIAIMMAQKFPQSNIVAVEIDKNAAEQASQNVQNCPWNDRITIFNDDFSNFAQKNTKKFDLIVSNPPFFENQLKSTNKQREIARHTTLLSFEKLTKNVAKTITQTGLFTVILPYYNHNNFIKLCSENDLFCTKKTIIFPNEKKDANRVLLEFSKQKKTLIENNFYIRQKNAYSSEYLELTKDFYLFA